MREEDGKIVITEIPADEWPSCLILPLEEFVKKYIDPAIKAYIEADAEQFYPELFTPATTKIKRQ